MTIRDDVTAYALGLAGLSANPNDALTRTVYRDTIAPGETGARANEMERMWPCELVACAVLRRFILHPLLERPYVDGTAGTTLSAIAREARAVRPLYELPEPGDVVIVAPPEHAWICLSAVPSPYQEGATLCDGIDGHPIGDYSGVIQRAHELLGGFDDAGSRRAITIVIDVERVVGRFGRS